MTHEVYSLRAKFVRRLPDPLFHKSAGIEHHIFLVNCRDLPRNLPLEANARRPNTRKQVYRQVRESLLNQEGEGGTFHLKNKGIVIVAEQVETKANSGDEFIIHLDRTRQGILDGGHTYQLIMDAQADGDLPDDQFVFVQIRTSVPKEWIPEISQGLNTSVQVQDMSLHNLAGKFAWLKAELKGKHYYSRIAWSENDPGDFSARDIIALMYLMNIRIFPDADTHPIAGYEKKSEALKHFDESDATFKFMRPVLHDVLYLHDWIAFTAADFYNRGAHKLGVKGRGAGLSFVKQANRKKFEATFLQPGPGFDTRLEDAALYPILAAFRVFLKQEPQTGKFSWIGGFEAAREAWEELAYELIKATLHTANEVGRSKNAIGKSRLHWDGLYQKVENYKLRRLTAAG
jgi:hypothetical protein